MKLLLLCCYSLSLTLTAFGNSGLQEVNAILHDQSFISVFGKVPEANTNEELRIKVHLFYVEKLLREKNTNTLNDAQKVNRLLVLDLLHKYWVAGIFPKNEKFAGERKPCFIDAEGRICAVGYLIKQTKGRKLAEEINLKYQYDFVLDMHEQAINSWANEFGLTLEECAMIQPTYGPIYSETDYAGISSGYWFTSATATAGNSFINTINLIDLFNSKKNNGRLPFFGLVTGTGQIVLGLANIRKKSVIARINGPTTYVSYAHQNSLSAFNIFSGTATIVTSFLNLNADIRNKKRKTAFAIYSYPLYKNCMVSGISFTRRL